MCVFVCENNKKKVVINSNLRASYLSILLFSVKVDEFLLPGRNN